MSVIIKGEPSVHVPWRGSPGLSVNVVLEMDGFNVDHINVLSSWNGEVVGKDSDLISVDLYGVILVEDVFLLGQLRGHVASSQCYRWVGSECV